MYKDKTIAVVIPCYNEETQISKVIETMPEYVDRIVVVDDNSSDDTVQVVKRLTDSNSKITLIEHNQNHGCGGALATGYIWVRDNGFDVTVRMDGDGQMDPSDLQSLLDPVVSDETDYAKGNRLFTGEAFNMIPKTRYIGNSILTLLTKVASGYWHVADSQSGYTVMNRNILKTLDWRFMYTRYGQPNHLLIMLNIYNFRVRDIPVKPIYGIGEESGIRIRKVIFTLSWLLFKNFLWRMKEKYFIRDFHPLIFFYFLGFSFSVLTIFLFGRLFFKWWILESIPPINALAAMFAFMSASLFTLFAMWFDMEENKNLR